MQTTINLGRVACNPRGMYNAATTYNRLDMVMYGGTGYICCANNVTGVVPSMDDTKWKIIVDASQISEFTVEEIIMTSGQGIMADIMADANGIAIDTNSITIDSGNDSVHVAGDTVTITDGNDTATIKSNSVKVEDVDNEFTEITSTQVNTPEVFTQKVAFSNSEITEIDDGENLILQMRAGVIDIDADAISLSEVNTQRLVANSTQSLIDIDSYNANSKIEFHKNGKSVKLENGALDADEAYVKELNMNADGDMGGVIVFGDKYGSENIIELSEKEDDELTIKAPSIAFTAPSNTQGLPNIYFKQKYGTPSYDNYNPLSLTWDNYSSGSSRKRPNITTALGLSMNSGGIGSPIYFNYSNIWSNLNTFKFQNVELPYTWWGNEITPTFKVGNYQIKHVGGQWGDTEIGKYDNWLNVYDYNHNYFMNGLSMMNRYDDGEGGYDTQDYMYFNTFDGEEGEESGVINAEFGLNYSGKELNIWNWNENDKMTLKTVHDDNTDTTEHIISAPNKLSISSDDNIQITAADLISLSPHIEIDADIPVAIEFDDELLGTKITTDGAIGLMPAERLVVETNSVDITANNACSIYCDDDTSIIADGVLTLEGHEGVVINNVVTINSDLNVASSDEVNIATGGLNASVDSMTVNSDNDIELTTNGARVVVGGQLVVTSGNTLKIGNTTITEAQLNALLALI